MITLKKLKKFNFILPVVWMLVIFFFSHQSGNSSSNLSSNFRDRIIQFLMKLGFDLEEDISHAFIRGLAHFFNFFVLYFLWYISFTLNNFEEKRSIILSILISISYAFLDEGHQYFIPDRGPSLYDVLIDSLGSLTSLILCKLFYILRSSRKKGVKA